jgi:beta-lactamase regulating signal transducer with metallopeptidase domain
MTRRPWAVLATAANDAYRSLAVMRFAYMILAIFFVASAICSTYALVRVKDLEARKYHTYTRADIDRFDAQTRHWMMFGVLTLATAILAFIPLVIVPATIRIGRAARRHAQLTSAQNRSGKLPPR